MKEAGFFSVYAALPSYFPHNTRYAPIKTAKKPRFAPVKTRK